MLTRTALAVAAGVTLLTMASFVSLAGAAPPTCLITNARTHQSYSSLQAANDARATRAGDTITVSGTCVGTMVVTKDLTITGVVTKKLPGPPTLDGEGLGSVVSVAGSYDPAIPPTLTVAIRDLIITDGATSGDGGGISSNGANVVVINTTVTANAGGLGGGIVQRGGSLTLSDSTVSNNTAYRGGGIFVYTGNATLNNSTVTGNTAILQGGGIELLDPIYGNGYPLGSVLLNNSTVTGNQPDNCVGPFAC